MSSKLVLKPLWSNGSRTYAVSFNNMSVEDRREVERLADEAGYLRDNETWTPPRAARNVYEFFRVMGEAGFGMTYDNADDGSFDLQRLHLSDDARRALGLVEDFELHHISGWAPVQAEGTLDGHYFYFRARGSYWRFELGGNERGTRSLRWWYEEAWPSVTGFEAGYMTDEEAVLCILKAADQFRNGDNSHSDPQHPKYERTILEGWSAGALNLRTVTIRLAISPDKALQRMQVLGVEVPSTADREVHYVKSLPIRNSKFVDHERV